MTDLTLPQNRDILSEEQALSDSSPRSQVMLFRVLPILTTLAVGAMLAYPSLLAWAGLALAVMLALVSWRSGRGLFPSTPFDVSLLLYCLGAAGGLLVAVHPPTAEIRGFGVIAGLVSFGALATSLRSAHSARRFCDVALIFTVIMAPLLLIVLYQFTMLAALPEPFPSWMTVLDPLRKVVLEGDEVLQRFRFRRSGLGALAGLGITLALGGLMAGPTVRRRLAALVAMGYFGIMLLVADNRGALLATALVVLLFLATWRRAIWLCLLGFVGVCSALIAGLVTLPTLEWLTAIRPDRASAFDNVQYRLDLWSNIAYLLSDYRFTGVGLGSRSVRETYETYFPAADPPFSHAHNVFLEMYLEQGPLGVAAMIGITLMSVIVIFQVLRVARDPMARSAAISASASALMLIIAGFTDIVIMTTGGMVLLFGALGVLSAVARLSSDASAPPRTSTRGVWVRRTALASIAGLVLSVAIGALIPRVSLSRTESARSPIQSALASAYLNLGSMELGRSTLGIDRSKDEREARLARAEEYLRQALESDPTNLAILRQSAAVSVAQSRGNVARRILADAEAQAPLTDSKAALQIGRIYRDAGDTDRAVAAWTRAGAVAELTQWGQRLTRNNSWKAASQVSWAVVETAPALQGGYRPLSDSLTRLKNRDAALAAFTALSREYPSVPWPYLEAGDLLSRAGDKAGARAWYEAAGKVAGHIPAVQQRLAAN